MPILERQPVHVVGIALQLDDQVAKIAPDLRAATPGFLSDPRAANLERAVGYARNSAADMGFSSDRSRDILAS